MLNTGYTYNVGRAACSWRLLSTGIIIKKKVSVKNTQSFSYEVEKQKNQ